MLSGLSYAIEGGAGDDGGSGGGGAGFFRATIKLFQVEWSIDFGSFVISVTVAEVLAAVGIALTIWFGVLSRPRQATSAQQPKRVRRRRRPKRQAEPGPRRLGRRRL